MKIDERLKSALEESELPHELMDTGDYLCEVQIEEGGTVAVFASSATEKFREYEIRGISIVVGILDGPLSIMAAHMLLENNAHMKMCSWSLQVGDGTMALVLTGRLPATASGTTLKLFIEGMAQIAREQQVWLESQSNSDNEE